MKAIIFLVLLVTLTAMVSAESFVTNTPIIKVVSEGSDNRVISNEISIISLKAQEISLEYFSEKDFLDLDTEAFFLGKDESRTISLSVDPGKLDKGVYTGYVSLKGDEEQIIPVILEIQDSFPLFDVSLESSQVKKIASDEDLSVDISVYNLRGLGKEVLLNYFVKNLEGDIIFEEQQELEVARQLKVRKVFSVSEGQEGDYVLGITAKDKQGLTTGTSSLVFSISPNVYFSPAAGNAPILIAFLIVISLITAFFIFNHFWSQRLITNSRQWNKKLVDVRKVKFSDTAKEIRKLERRKDLLEHACEKGYISKKSFFDGRKKIDELINKLKKRL